MDSSDQLRHLCEVLWIIKLPSRMKRREYLDVCRKSRGDGLVQRLRDDVKAWWHRRDELETLIAEARSVGGTPQN